MPNGASPRVSEPASFFRRAWQRLYWLPTDRRTCAKFKGYGSILVYGDSLGDNLLCTVVARELHRRGRGPVSVITAHPDLFRNNPNIAACYPADWGEVASLQRARLPLLRPDYVRPTEEPDRLVPPDRNIIAEMCASAGISGPVELKPDYFFGLDENIRIEPRRIVLQSGGAGAGLRILNKEWPAPHFQAVVDDLRRDFAFVQLGTSADPPLQGVEDLRGRTNLREAAALIASSACFLGLEGFLMHLARAVGRRSVIVYGGRVSPDQIGYPCNENLYSPVPCAPCWRYNGCGYDRRCLAEIVPSSVVQAVHHLLTRAPTPLETTVVNL